MFPMMLPLALWSLANKTPTPNLAPPVSVGVLKNEARKAIQAVYDKQNAGIRRKDIESVVFGCAPEFVEAHQEQDMKGQMFTLTQLRPMVAQLFAQAQTARRTTTIEKFDFAPTQVTATVQQHLVMALVNPRTKKAGQLVQDGISRDVWIKGEQGWIEQKSTILSGQTRVTAQKPTQ